MMKRGLVVLIAAGAIAAVSGCSVVSTLKSPPRLFKRNAELKVQGYYMGEFEFKMLTAVYYLNEGRYWKAYRTLRRIETEMESLEGLVKMPDKASPQERMAFMLERQYRGTGAFMDPAYPYFTYFAPTANAVEALEDLAQKAGQPLTLKHELRFLDEIRTPQQLRAFLGSVLYIQDKWARMSPGPYVAVTELASFDVLERNGLYRFSEEWKDDLRRWFHETQDPATGYWGTRIGDPGNWRQNRDPNSTFHILKLVVDERGNDRSEKYPLRYAGALARSILLSLAAPIPDDTVEEHGWRLDQDQGATMLIRLLWPHLSEAERRGSREALQRSLISSYGHYFRPADGGFSLYASAPRADVDGTGGGLMLLQTSGSLPGTWERDRLWGETLARAPEPVRTNVRHWNEAALPPSAGANSVRVYRDALPAGDSYDDASLVQISYLGDSPVLDVMDLRQRVARFLAADGQMFGNWTSKESLLARPLDLQREIKAVPVSRGAPDLARLGRDHPGARRFYVVGYDLFQVPVFRAEFVKLDRK
jgi:hypothetical protein